MKDIIDGGLQTGYTSPTDSKRLTSPVGTRSNAKPSDHKGIDIGAKKRGIKGDPLYAISDGKVTRVGKTDSGCSVLEIKLDNGDSAVYIHGKYTAVKGARVRIGDKIGTMSNIGSPKDVHLHFEIRRNGVYPSTVDKAIDPVERLPAGFISVN